MKQLFAILFFAFAAAGCGSDDNPADAGGNTVVDETFTVSAGAFRPFTITIDADIQQNAFVQGNFEVKDSGTINFAIMTQAEYRSWQAGAPLSSVLHTPDTSGGAVSRYSFRIDLTTSGTYYLVFSNLQQAETKTIEAEIYLFSFIEE